MNQVDKYQDELALGRRYLTDHYRPKIVIRQNIRDPSDLICTLHSNSRFKRTHDGISPASEFEHPYFHNEEPHIEEIDPRRAHLNGPPKQLSPMSPEELEWWLRQIPSNRRTGQKI